ncbi:MULTISPECIES: MazG family protein [unclassified Rhodococcus (in: high G+C Gram-positive bacteria)]|uniref:MazG family protein n=1 Tax=unclassified Rhodococcus (in: high G+C Gram-positive bacteria) TaxID=192944 RepID=UPI0009E7D785|nr:MULTISPECIES: MazG family protein [unclassified Rhodococcus (in: high G+C Gram-positive bacteria)]
MTILLLDPLRPTMVPVQAVTLLDKPVGFTEEVPVSIRWRLTGFTSAGDDEPEVLISTSRDNPDVQERITRGEDVIEVPVPRGGNLAEAVFVIDKLRSLGGWEAQQTHESLRGYLLEETYELLDAIETGDADSIREELGDLLLQVIFHARIAKDAGAEAFDIDDVASTLVAKLTHRSPHLADTSGAPIDIGAQEKAWEERKAAEKVRASCLDGIAMAQPSLALAQQVITRAVKAGLPQDFVPESMLSVRIDISGDHGATSAEDSLRRTVNEFVADVRAAERGAAMDGVRSAEMDSRAWSKYWPGTDMFGRPLAATGTDDARVAASHHRPQADEKNR